MCLSQITILDNAFIYIRQASVTEAALERPGRRHRLGYHVADSEHMQSGSGGLGGVDNGWAGA